MFVDLSWSHILLFLVIALIVVGPQDLPKLMRKIGQWVAKARNLADQFRSSFDEMARQSELDELRKEIESLRNAKPLAETERQLNEALKIPEISMPPLAPQVESAPPQVESAALVEPAALVVPEFNPDLAAPAAPAETADVASQQVALPPASPHVPPALPPPPVEDAIPSPQVPQAPQP